MTADRNLDIHDMAGHLIRRLNQISTSVFQERMKTEGVDLTPVQFAALDAIDTCPGIDQATLAGMIAYDKATIGGVVDRLEAKSYVLRKVSRRDRRARELSLTKDGAGLLQRLYPIVVSLQDDVLRGLTSKEKKDFLKLAKKATDAGNTLSRAPMSIGTPDLKVD